MALVTRSKPPTHYKKVAGKHHKATKSYLKTYWPYIPLTAIVAMGLLVNGVLGGSGSVLGAVSDLTTNSLLQDTNEARTGSNENALLINNQLNMAAEAKAQDMVARNYWSHTSPDGKTPWNFINSTGYTYTTAGENLAYGFSDAEGVLQAWMNSPEHRANILNANYKDVGFGIAASPNFNHRGPATVVVAMYGGSQSSGVFKNNISVPSTNSAVAGATYAATIRPVARVQLLTHSYDPGPATFIALAGITSIVLFSIRHARAWRRVLNRGEDFMLEHIWIDMLIVTIATASYLLVQGGGAIG